MLCNVGLLLADQESVPTKEAILDCFTLEEDGTWTSNRIKIFFWVLDNLLPCVIKCSLFNAMFVKKVTVDFWKVVSRSDIIYLFYSIEWNYDKAVRYATLMRNHEDNGKTRKEIRKDCTDNNKKKPGEKEERLKMYALKVEAFRDFFEMARTKVSVQYAAHRTDKRKEDTNNADKAISTHNTKCLQEKPVTKYSAAFEMLDGDFDFSSETTNFNAV